MKPFLKWAGGKGRHAQRILRECFGGMTLPIDLYVEPFVGAGATLLAAIEMKVAKQYVGADANAELIATWVRVRDDSAELVAEVEALAAQFAKLTLADREVFYLSVRDGGVQASVAARMIFLNRTCFNGLYRVNASGKFNAPCSQGENGSNRGAGFNTATRSISEVGTGLTGFDVRFIAWPFAQTFQRAIARSEAGERVVLYADPPYGAVESKEHGFVMYTAAGFTQDDQRALVYWVREALRARVRVVLTNGAYAGNATAYRSAGLGVVTMDEIRSINSDGDGRGGVPCLLCYGGGKYE